MKPNRESYFSHQRRQSSNNNSISNGLYPSSPSASSFSSSPSTPSSSSSTRHHKLRGIHINISSDPFQHRIPPYLQRLWQESRWKQYAFRIRRLGRRYYGGARLWQLVVISISCICVVLLFHVGFFSGKKYQDWERHGHGYLGEGDERGYMDELDLLNNVYPDAGKGLTALIVVAPPYADPLPTILPILASLCEHDIFGEVFIWNNHQTGLTMNQLLHPDIQSQHRCPDNKLTIHNSSTDLKSTSRYMACTMARTPYCYFYDPLPLSSSNKQLDQALHIRSVYANFLRSPTLVHGETIDRSHYTATQWTWCFWYESNTQDQQKPNIHLHTCYTPPGTGIFVTKDMATRFINQLELDPIDPAFADMYFTLWMNQGAPYLIQGSSTTSGEKKALTTEEMEHLHHGLRTLYNSLKNGNGILTEKDQHGGTLGDTKQEEKRTRHARAACHDDRCLYLTNVPSLPHINLISYDPTNSMSSVQDSIRLHDDYYSDTITQGGGGIMARHTYDNAVDGRDDTAWMSPDYIRKGDYIGLDLLMPVRIPLRYRILVDHPYLYHKAIQYQMSYDGALWIDLNLPAIKCVSLDQRVQDNPNGVNDLSLLECRFTVPETGYRFLRLAAMHDLDYRFIVYDLSVSAKVKRDKNGQFLDVGRDDRLAFVED